MVSAYAIQAILCLNLLQQCLSKGCYAMVGAVAVKLRLESMICCFLDSLFTWSPVHSA